MRLDHHANTYPRLLRKTALGDVPATSPNPRTKTTQTSKVTAKPAGPEKPKQPRTTKTAPEQGGSRFVGATHLDDAQKVRIGTALESRGIGDEIGRQILIGALEYQLSAFAGQLQRRGETPRQPSPLRDDAAHQALQTLGEQTQLLANRLRKLPDRSRVGLTRALAEEDRLGHSYDDRYLCELACEIERLEHACARASAPEVETQPKVGTEDPASSRALVAKLASVFAECFEQEPTAEPGGPFQTLLAVLDKETGFVIAHDPGVLKGILSR